MPINLEKGTPISLQKVDGGVMSVTLTWQSPRVDVDLACMCQTFDERGRLETPKVVQALGNSFGSLHSRPFVQLDQDARSGGSSETLTVNLSQAQYISRLLVFAYIYEGGQWKDAGDARVVVNHPAQGEFVFDFSEKNARTCTLVNLQNDGSGNLTLTREEVFFKGFHQDVDKHYGWPKINWVAGSK
jgi:tellurite resistance protein TerA